MSSLNQLTKAGLLAAMVGAFGLTGCGDKTCPGAGAVCGSVDVNAKPTIVRVIAVDQNSFKKPVESAENPGTSVTLDAVPINNSIIRIYFNKVVDGATIEQNPGGTYCEPASNITVSAADASGPITDFAASVCYDPTGPAIVVTPAKKTCAGLEPLSHYQAIKNRDVVQNYPGLAHGVTYTIAATGVKDHNSNSLDFSVVVKSADLGVDDVTVTTSYGSDGLAAASDSLKGGNVPVAPPGVADKDSGLYTVQTYQDYFGEPNYGNPVDITFNAPMCQMNPLGASYPYLCDSTGGNFYGSTPGVTFTIDGAPTGLDAVDYDSVSDNYFAGDIATIHLTPVFPLEDDTTYSIKADTTVVDQQAGTLKTAFDGKFKSAPGSPKVDWTSPSPGATGVHATVDPGHLQNWDAALAVGFATSKPAKVDATGAIIGAKFTDATGADVAGVSDDVEAYEARGRTAVFGPVGGAKKVALKNATDYKMSLTGAQTTDGTAIADASFTFKTLPFDNDPGVPGLVDFGGLLKSNKGNVNIVNAYGTASTYMIFLTGAADYDSTQDLGPAIPAGTYKSEYFGLKGGTVTMVGPDGAAIAGIGGNIKFTKSGSKDPWAYSSAAWPGSIVAFTPTAPLDFNKLYTITVEGVKSVNGDSLPTIKMPFKTAPFRISAVWDSVGIQLAQVLNSGTAHTVLDVGAPLTIRTTGLVDVADFPPDAVLLIESTANGVAQVPINLANASPAAGANHRGFTVEPQAALKPNTTYTLQLTSKIVSHTASPTPIPTFTVTFITEDGPNNTCQ